MAADSGAEIDLYDNIEEDFVQDSSELTELYDDVIAPPSSESTNHNETKPNLATPNASHTGRRIATYVGNLTWWTTDVDLYTAFNNLGITDILEIKFHENRQNGQSKGFCVIVFGSEQSVRTAMEKLSKIEINGQTPVITYCTKHNLSLFEKAAGGEGSLPSSSGTRDHGASSTGLLGVASSSGTSLSGSRNAGVSNNGRLPPPLMGTPALPASLGFSMRGSSSLMGRASVPSTRQSTAPLPLGLSAIPQTFQSLLMSNPLGILPSGLQQNQGSGLIPPAFGLGGGATTSLAGANAHINPNFFQQGASSNASQAGTGGHAALPNPLLQAPQLGASALRPQLDQFGRPLVHTYTPSQSGKLNDSEFEDILQRNKTVSSSAINRAVQDAAGGDYASAIETLVTAISLIKQSKIASDDRCKILINSLQDTLHGIESKSYGSKSSSSRRRRRSYSDSGSECNDSYPGSSAGGGGSSSRRRGERDRSRRSRSRDRHRNDDRHRRSRDRDHDSRSSRDYYSQSGMNSLTASVSPPRTGSISSDRYRENRYRQ